MMSFHTLRARLAEAGCPERTVRAIIQAAILAEYRPRLAELFRQSQGDFWERHVVVKSARSAPQTAEQTAARNEFAALQQERDRLLRELAGPDWDHPAAVREADAGDNPRLSFLSPEKQALLQAQEAAIRELRQDLRAQGFGQSEVENEVRDLKRQQEQERQEWLTPAEAAEYDLRHSRFEYVVRNLYGFEPSAEERQMIIRLHEAHEGRVPDPELRRALGADRAAEYKRARDPAYCAIHRVAEHLRVPEKPRHDLYQIKLDAETQANSIREQAGLSPTQRARLLRSLAAETDTAVAQRLGAAGRDLYLKNGGWWIQQLAATKP